MLTITLSDETYALLDAEMKRGGFENADDVVRAAFEALAASPLSYEDLDAETRAAIEEAEGQPDIPWEEAKAELMARVVRKPVSAEAKV